MDSPLLQEVLTHSTKKLNEVNNGTSLFKIDTVKKATVQVRIFCYKHSDTNSLGSSGSLILSLMLILDRETVPLGTGLG